jgi:CBS domain containing-hemolysin-like protein
VGPLLVSVSSSPLTAFYVAAEFAAVSVRKGRIRQRAETATPFPCASSPSWKTR